MMRAGLYSYFLLLIFFSCQNVHEKNTSSVRPGKAEMEDFNRYLVQKDRERILNYIERKELKMTETPTGLWCQIIKPGTGSFFTDGDNITLNYDCSLLDGSICYSSEKLGPKVLILGKTVMEPGMNEGLRLLKPGAEAIFIMPTFLAHGFTGDGKKIPPRSVIVYHIYLP